MAHEPSFPWKPAANTGESLFLLTNEAKRSSYICHTFVLTSTSHPSSPLLCFQPLNCFLTQFTASFLLHIFCGIGEAIVDMTCATNQEPIMWTRIESRVICETSTMSMMSIFSSMFYIVRLQLSKRRERGKIIGKT